MIKCALQLYSVREILMSDPRAVLQKVAEIGWGRVELPIRKPMEPRWYGLSAREIKKVARESGLEVIGGYATMEELRVHGGKDVFRFFEEAGMRRIVIPICYFPSLEELERICGELCRIGRECEKRGLALCYETHYHEFQEIRGSRVIDLILERVPPESLKLALNIYWLYRGLEEPVKTLRRYAGRVDSLVLQDYPLDEADKFNIWRFERYHPIAKNIRKNVLLQGGEIENIAPVQCTMFTEFGAGMLNFAGVLDEAKKQGLPGYAVLKQDYTRKRSEYDSIAESLEHARKTIELEI